MRSHGRLRSLKSSALPPECGWSTSPASHLLLKMFVSWCWPSRATNHGVTKVVIAFSLRIPEHLMVKEYRNGEVPHDVLGCLSEHNTVFSLKNVCCRTNPLSCF
ncbi:hypothetical protein MLD38_033445 [Melastoma candidum]|uniref:Uncharacterized protein n=1 Tax=Melastoma candidum TaxID=119954 RepID=A0ACB9M6K2_9MYRT|nr:hypothetical protein MLD38_033445 [Melastoma candidum]